jgi:peptide/nickel transport system substrate-binding protein
MVNQADGPARIGRRDLLSGATAGTVAACWARSGVAQDSKVLTVRAYLDIANLDPAHRVSQPDADVMLCIFTALADLDAGDTWRWVPRAAKTIKQLDQTHVSFELNPGIVYSNGFGEMVADDVKFSIERMVDPKTASEYADDWSALDHVEIKDRYSGIIVLKRAFAPLLKSTLPSPSSIILPRKALDAVGGKFDTKPPCESGPYRIKSWEPKQSLVLTRNPDWKLDRPYFDEIHILPIEDEKTAELGLEAGEVDFTMTSVSSIQRYQRSTPKRTEFVKKPSLAFVWLGISQATPKLRDIRIRHALQLGVDRDAVVQAATLGGADPATGIIAPSLLGHREKNLYDRDVAQARDLLKHAGVGAGFSVKLAILNKAENLAAAQVIQANLADIGVSVEIDPYDGGTFWTLGVEKDGPAWKSVELLLDRFSMEPDPSFATEWFTPQQIGEWNWEWFNSAEFGRINAAATTELDDTKRAAMYRHLQDLMEESGSYVFLTNGATGLLYKSSIVPALRPDGVPLLPGFRGA